MYVQTILDVHKKYNALVMSAFNNDAGFVAALDKVWSNLTIFCGVRGFHVVSRTLLLLSLNSFFPGLWTLHKQQCCDQDGTVVQQIPRAAG